MTSDIPRAAGLALAMLGLMSLGAQATESYPFEGTWVRANRTCTANAPHAKTYLPHEIASSAGRCTIRKVAAGSGQFEIFEDCRRGEHPGNFTETIRMLGPDAMVVRRQAARLKIARPLRWNRCSIAAPSAPKPAVQPGRKPTTGAETPPVHQGQGQERAPKATEPTP